MDIFSQFSISTVFEIIIINVLLSGDNAIVIALACRSLPPAQRKWGIMLGSGAAVLLRILFTLIVVQLLALPYLKLIGGLLLLWIAVKLVIDETDHSNVKAHGSIWNAVQTIAIADAVMSLDNVVAIAAVAKGSMPLIIFGLIIAIPLVVFGSSLLLKLIERFPVLVWAGAALLGWVAGDILSDDSAMVRWFGAYAGAMDHWMPYICTALVLGLAWILWRRPARRPGDNSDGRRI